MTAGIGIAGLPLADSPLGRTVANTATDIWNDSCALDELEYALSYGAVGATANLQALWACRSDQMVHLNLPIVGAERFEQQYPFGSMLRAGIPLAMGSDWPVSTPDPWQAIHVAVNRREPGKTAQLPLGAGEALGLRDALAAYTSGSARVIHTPGAGRLVVGGRADLALANVDPFDSADADLHATRNVATVVAGRLTHLLEA